MYQPKIEENLDCGIRIAFKVFGGKWKLCIIDAIHRGITRPHEIHKAINEAPLRVIEMQLAELLQHRIIEKSAFDVFPKRTEYRLTELGESVLPILSQIDHWGTENSSSVLSTMHGIIPVE